jgi:ubiquinone/menaquinone biosynthesis C-methylase UbiE
MGRDVHVHIGNLSDFKFKEGYFDAIFLSNVIEHMTMAEILITFKEIYRILGGGGRLIIISPNFRYSYKSYFDDYTHKTIFTDKSLKDIVIGSGFVIDKLLPKFLPFSADLKLPKSPWLTKLYLLSPIKPFSGQMLCIATKQGVRK